LGSVVRTRTCQVKSKSLAKKTRTTIQSHIMCSFETGEDCNLPPKEKTAECRNLWGIKSQSELLDARLVPWSCQATDTLSCPVHLIVACRGQRLEQQCTSKYTNVAVCVHTYVWPWNHWLSGPQVPMEVQ
jgi:hypothetical protein